LDNKGYQMLRQQSFEVTSAKVWRNAEGYLLGEPNDPVNVSPAELARQYPDSTSKEPFFVARNPAVFAYNVGLCVVKHGRTLVRGREVAECISTPEEGQAELESNLAVIAALQQALREKYNPNQHDLLRRLVGAIAREAVQVYSGMEPGIDFGPQMKVAQAPNGLNKSSPANKDAIQRLDFYREVATGKDDSLLLPVGWRIRRD
jgi:hypothetical protein